MPEHPSAAQLAKVPLLADLTASELTALADRFEVETFDTGRPVVAEGHAGSAFYLLADGSATVSVDGAVVRTLAPGDHFGEIAVLDLTSRRTATVVPTQTVTVWTLHGAAFRTLQRDHPDVAEALEQATRERLASSETWRD